jgi:hypothetical protein
MGTLMHSSFEALIHPKVSMHSLLLASIAHLHFMSGVWLGVDLRIDIKKTRV